MSGTSFKPETAQERKRSNIGAAIAVDESNREVWMEVSDEIILGLEVDYKKARDERVSWFCQSFACRDKLIIRTLAAKISCKSL